MTDYEAPKIEIEKLEKVHCAKSWNPGRGNDTTGTGNSGNNPNSGPGNNSGHGNGNGNGRNK